MINAALQFFDIKKIRGVLYSMSTLSGWWFQPIWKILYSQNGNLPQIRVKIKNLWNHHLVIILLTETNIIQEIVGMQKAKPHPTHEEARQIFVRATQGSRCRSGRAHTRHLAIRDCYMWPGMAWALNCIFKSKWITCIVSPEGVETLSIASTVLCFSLFQTGKDMIESTWNHLPQNVQWT